ncbi:MAG: hypothetical protein QM770_17280 [Tepidisphaeraceae bacterium]
MQFVKSAVHVPIALAVCLTVAGVASRALAADNPVAAATMEVVEETPPIEVRVYPVSDLLQDWRSAVPGAKDQTLFEKRGGNGSAVSSQTPPGPDRQSRLDFISHLVMSVVAPESWRDNGGTIGGIQAFNDSLIVQQTAANHAALSKLLNDLRQGPPQVHVEAVWIQLDPQAVETLSRREGTVRVLTQPLSSLPADARLGSGEFTAFSGDEIALRSGKDVPYVSDIEPIVGSGAVGFDPTIDVIHTGLDVSGAVFLIGTDTARLNLRGSLDELQEMKTFNLTVQGPTTRPADSGGTSGQIQQPIHGGTSLDVRMVVPIGKTVLVGGVSNENDADAGHRKLRYLLLTISAE